MIPINSLFKGRHFVSLPGDDGMLSDVSQDRHPTQVYAWGYSHQDLTLNVKGTSFGFVYSGQAAVTLALSGRQQTFYLETGMYFSIPNSFAVSGGCGFITSRLGYQGTFMIGGPIEKQGRLLYNDHPMINRTIVGGVSAANMQEIRTAKIGI